MSMFDYDARPATDPLRLVGTRVSATAYEIRDFLSRNGLLYKWIDIDQTDAVDLIDLAELDTSQLPLCIFPDGARLAPASVEQVATGLGMMSAPALSEYDLVIIGAGPAGLGAAVYAASEGLQAVVVEAVAPGGQAGTTSMIENYLGFPEGVSGSELATRAVAQARRFGGEILVARRLVDIAPDGPGYMVELSEGSRVRGRAVLLASGVDWRRLEVPGIDDLLGAGVYYGAGPSEAMACRGAQVVVVGGGNSAGQAAARFARYARKVSLVVRGHELGSSMSRYMVDGVRAISNIEVRTGSEVVGVEANGHLQAAIVSADRQSTPVRLPTDALFICIGGIPRTEGAKRLGLVADNAGYLRTGSDLASDATSGGTWQLTRPPLPLETSFPGLFVAGDVRSGSIKRCAAAIGEGAMAVALVHRRLEELGGE